MDNMLVNKVAIMLLLVMFCLRGTSAIMCYDCSSDNDPRCADPFDSYSIGKVDCSKRDKLEHLSHLEPVLCRKTVMKIYGKTRIVRSCGYIKDEKDDVECMKRSGTHDVQVHYCSCTKDFCNGSPTLYSKTQTSMLLVFSVTIITFFNLKQNCLAKFF